MIEWIKTHASKIDLPILFVQAANDPLLNVAGMRHFFGQIPYPDKTIHNHDINYTQILSDIKSWMEKRIKTRKKRWS